MHTLETKLGYVFHRPELLENALYHSSYANEHRGAGISSNERLEFLGDAVLGFVTAEYLYAKHPDMPEGDLTRIRAALVCEESLHEVAQSLDLGSHLLLGKGEEQGGGRTRESILPREEFVDGEPCGFLLGALFAAAASLADRRPVETDLDLKMLVVIRAGFAGQYIVQLLIMKEETGKIGARKRKKIVPGRSNFEENIYYF